MEQKDTTSGGSDLLKSIIPLLSDLFPLIMEKWADVNDRPYLKSLERELSRTRRKLEGAQNLIRWLFSFFFLLLVWNVFLTIFLVYIRR